MILAKLGVSIQKAVSFFPKKRSAALCKRLFSGHIKSQTCVTAAFAFLYPDLSGESNEHT